MLSHKEKKILATKTERDLREAAKRQRLQENVQTLQELQRLLLQVRPDLVGPPQRTMKAKTTKNPLGTKISCNQEIIPNETASCEEKEEENNSNNIEDDEYVKDFETEPAIVENDYYYL